MKRKHILWLVSLGILIVTAILWGPIVSQVEQPKYTLIHKERLIEVREYPAIIVAESTVNGPRTEAIREGFRRIADYIFGNNISSQKVAMTAPVTQQPGEKIAMTAPVTQQSEGDKWLVRFIMPAKETMETLPKPANPAVHLKAVSKKRFAVIRFSGIAGQDSIDRYTSELQTYLNEKNISPLSAPVYAFYNPPWTLPFLRRNEIMIEIPN